jgi:hypothetical protein
MPATVIAERIGWDRSIRVLRARLAELRPAYLPPDPASRTAYEPGEVAQCDLWFPPVVEPQLPGAHAGQPGQQHGLDAEPGQQPAVPRVETSTTVTVDGTSARPVAAGLNPSTFCMYSDAKYT